jgi:hypothetical protein
MGHLGQLRPGAGALGLVSAHPVAVTLGLLIVKARPLIWRRSWPITVFLTTGLPRLLFDQLGHGFAPLPLAPAIAYYAVMARCPTSTRWVISAATLVGIVRSQELPGHNEPYHFFVAVLPASPPRRFRAAEPTPPPPATPPRRFRAPSRRRRPRRGCPGVSGRLG